MDLTLAIVSAVALATSSSDGRTADARLGPVMPPSRVVAALPMLPQLAAIPQPGAPRDTVIEYSRAYYTRLAIHRWGSYTILPLFAAQAYLGSQLYSGDGDDAKDAHVMVALGVATLFAANTTTGLMNLWAMRADPNDRKRRITHVTLMLLADAGFVATGILADDAEAGGGSGARTHRAVALSSMVVSTVGWLIMTDLFRKD
jgi:hypothetical protein